MSLSVLESNDESERLRSERIWFALKFHPAWITAWSVPVNKRKEAAGGVFVFTVYWYVPTVGSILAGHACDNKNDGKSRCLLFSMSGKSLWCLQMWKSVKWAVRAQLCDESKNLFLFAAKILQAVRQPYKPYIRRGVSTESEIV